jgi:hypothetical protein
MLPASEYERREPLVISAFKACGKEVNMWNEEEYDMVGAFEDHDLECEVGDDSSELDLDSDMTEDLEEEAFDEDDPYADEED